MPSLKQLLDAISAELLATLDVFVTPRDYPEAEGFEADVANLGNDVRTVGQDITKVIERYERAHTD